MGGGGYPPPPTRPFPGVPVSSIWYPVPGIAVELVKTGPKWPKKVRLTLPKGRGPLVKTSIFDCFGAHVAWLLVSG